jgi:tRNA(fMet)-specific endonuclease VapC
MARHPSGGPPAGGCGAVKFLLDTDHISILQRQSGPEFAALAARIAQHQISDITFSVVSFHKQALGCHTYIARARTSADVVRGYAMFERVLDAFAAAQVLPMMPLPQPS